MWRSRHWRSAKWSSAWPPWRNFMRMRTGPSRHGYIDRRIAWLESQVQTPKNEEEPSYLSEEALHEFFVNGELRFDGPAQVSVGQFVGKSTPEYAYLSELAAAMSRWRGTQPDTIFLPITLAKVELALRCLDAGLLIANITTWGDGRQEPDGVMPKWAATSTVDGKCHAFGEPPFDIWELSK